MPPLERKRIHSHLSRLFVDGFITDAVVAGAYESAAVSPDQQLAVLLPALDRVEALPEEIGIVSLDKVLAAVKSGASGDVVIKVDDARLIVQDREKGSVEYRFVTAARDAIGTQVDDATEKALRKSVKDGEEVNLEQPLVQGILDAYALLKSEEIILKVGKKKGESVFQVGHDNAHHARFVLNIKSSTTYELNFNAKLIAAVFRQLTDFSTTKLVLTGDGADQMVGIRDGDYLYIVSPLQPDDEG